MPTNEHIFSEFTNVYSLSKTLRFALIPVGKTAETIRNNNLLQIDRELADKYKQAKKIIDEYHKEFINERLSEFEFSIEDLESFQNAYYELQKDKSNSSAKTAFETIQKDLRKEVAECLKKEELFKKELIQKELPEWLLRWLPEHPEFEIPDTETIIKDFHSWTSYFTGFHENRKNVYTPEKKSTSIAYRIVHDNLPKFIVNITRYKEAKKLGVDFAEVEKEYGVILDDVFTLDYFNNCLGQRGIDFYNLIRGGLSTQKDKSQGINEKINLFAQKIQHRLASAIDDEKNLLKNEIKNLRSCMLEELYKQILSDRSHLSFSPDAIKNDAELCKQITDIFHVKDKKLVGVIENNDPTTKQVSIEAYRISETISSVLTALAAADASMLYLNANFISTISKNIFNNWALIQRALEYYAENEKLGHDKNGTPKKYTQAQREKWLKKSYFSFSETHAALKAYMQGRFSEGLGDVSPSEEDDTSSIEITQEVYDQAISEPLYAYFQALGTTQIIGDADNNTEKDTPTHILDSIIKCYDSVLPVFEEYGEYESEKLKNAKENKDSPVLKIKYYLDSIQELYWFLKPLEVKEKTSEEKSVEIYTKDTAFYNDFDVLFKSLSHITFLYNQTRNYLTKKSYNIEKYKLNFKNQTLAGGWDRNKETDNTAIIFRKDGLFYLGIMDKDSKGLFEKDIDDTGECYEKMVYKLLPGPEKMLPKVFFGKQNIDYYNPSEDILGVRNTASHTKNGSPKADYSKAEFNRDDMRKMIDFYKESINRHPDWKNFNFKFSDTTKYSDYSDFIKEVADQGYTIDFINIAKSYIDEQVDKGNLFLFQIYNKDFSTNKSDKNKNASPNLHTLYWNALFDPENLKNVMYKLNGEAELFFRKASITYEKHIWERGHHDETLKGKFSYPIIKDRRYAKDRYLFHIPITLNFRARERGNFNIATNTHLKEARDINIIGIDRGERHLAYYTIIDQNGKIIRDKEGNYLQGSLNNPNSKKDYHELLDKREKERDAARKSWGSIGKIKDLKEGYLSQVVHSIVSMMIKHNAIVVFEDLNFGFKKGRFKIEKQVYQKLEKMLIDKLNYLVIKSKKPDEYAGLYNALQLSSKFESFQKLGKQTGWIFYVPAYHTSKVCPATGFVNLLYPRYETLKLAQAFFNKFDSIQYNPEKDIFEFSFTYANFTKKTEGLRQEWTLCSNGTRVSNFRNPEKENRWDSKEIHLTKELKELFDKNNIDYTGGCIKSSIVKQDSAKFFKALLYYLRLMLQLRNSIIGSDKDWVLSPVRDKTGKFFDSREHGSEMPQNADANGAYHIGLKGLMILQQLKECDDVSKFKPDLSNKEWYKFIQDK